MFSRLADGTIVRRKALDTPTGMAIAQLRATEILAPARAVNTGCDPPELSDDGRFSLMLDEVPKIEHGTPLNVTAGAP